MELQLKIIFNLIKINYIKIQLNKNYHKYI